MKKMMKMLMSVSCALLAGTVMAEDNAEPVWRLITPKVTMQPNKYGDDVPEIDGYSTEEYVQVREAVKYAKSGSTILLLRDCSSPQSDVEVNTNKAVTIDLNGHSLTPRPRELGFKDAWTIVFTGQATNAVLNIMNGTLSNDLQFVTQDTTGDFSVVLGPNLVSDGDITTVADVNVILVDGFRSAYGKVYSTEVPLKAEKGARFACRHDNSADPNPSVPVLVFSNPRLELLYDDNKDEYVVGEPVPDRAWSPVFEKWMADIPDDTPIYRICLPGSHDSGMSTANMESYNASSRTFFIPECMFVTQSLCIKDQLAYGTRAFDLRFRWDKDRKTLRTWHGNDAEADWKMMYGERLDSILDATYDFLTKNTSEVVIIELTHNGSDVKNGITQDSTLADVLKRIREKFDGDKKLLYKWDGQGEVPMLNDITLGAVRGKLILLVQPVNDEAPDPSEIKPQDGVWGVITGARTAYMMKPGYYGVFDDYANRDTVSAVKDYYINGRWKVTDFERVWENGRWLTHTATRIREEDKGNKTTAFCLSWTGTFSADESIYNNPRFVVLLSFMGIILLLSVLAVAAFSGPLGILAGIGVIIAAGVLDVVIAYFSWRFSPAFGRGIDTMAKEFNPVMVDTVKNCMAEIDPNTHTNKFLKPSVIWYDFVEGKYNRGIIELNADLCKYAAEVVRPDGTVDRKYENLNDAFTNVLLRVENNGCTVRLLRSESPDDPNGFVVAQECRYAKLDLNGKFLNRGEKLGSGEAVLKNFGTLEIVNSKPESGGIDIDHKAIVNGDVSSPTATLIVNGVSMTHKGGTGSPGLILNKGGKVILNNARIGVSSGAASTGIYLAAGEAFLTNSTISVNKGIAVRTDGGTVEMFGGTFHQNSDNNPLVQLSKNSRFTLLRGELDGRKAIAVNDTATMVVRDGFVRGGTSESKPCFSVATTATLEAYNGCFGAQIPEKYVVKGMKCFKTDVFPAYRYEIVPCGPSGAPEVAWIVETEIGYPTVQAAVDAVENSGGRQTIELLCNTHPVETVVIPAETGVTLDLNGFALVKRGTDNPAVCNYGGLTLTDSSVDCVGCLSAFSTTPVASAKGGVIYNAGTLLVDGGEIRDGLAAKGGGIYNETNGFCLVESGLLADCRATESGGGVFNCGRLVIRGGQIAKCTADKSGGGIWNAGDLKVRDGAIRACTASFGGGLANCRNASLFGGVIADNVSTKVVGAGIYADMQTETMICGAWVKDLIAVAPTHSSTARVRIFEGYFGDAILPSWIEGVSVQVSNEDDATKAEYPYVVRQKAVAEVDGRLYKTLGEAMQQTVGSEEKRVRLLSHVRNADTVMPDDPCNAVLDLSGHWIMGCDAALTLKSSSRLRIVDTVGGGTVNCLFATNAAQACSIRNVGICRIEGGRYADPIENGNTMSVKLGLFSHNPDDSWIAPSSSEVPNDDDLTRYEYPFAVIVENNAFRADDPTDLLPLQEALDDNDLTEEDLQTILLAEDSDSVSVTVREGHRAVLDLRGRRLHGVAHRPVVTVERGAALTIVDSVGGGLILKEDVNRTDLELVGGIVNYGDLTLAGGTISNCCGRVYGGVYNAVGATFRMSGGSIAGCGTTEADNESAPGVLNAGTFWMSGGEIVGCRSAGGVMAVCNLTGAEFNQLGGTIADGYNGVGENDESTLVYYVRNLGRYVLVDGQVIEHNVRQTGHPRECIYNAFLGLASGGSFIQLWGTVTALDGANDCAISFGSNDKRLFRVSNGMIDGRVAWHYPGTSLGGVSGGFFTTNEFMRVMIDSFCSWEINTDAATKQKYPWRVVPQYEAEVFDSTGTVVGHCMLQQGLDLSNDQGVRLRLVTDVKDCVTCSNAAPVTLDLNGFAITGTGKIFADGFARPVIRNEGTLTVFDSSTSRSGFIAMPSDGTAEEGGAICNHGTLCVSNVVIFGTRARRGGGVFNAEGATADLVKVGITGCQATEAASGDLIGNAGALKLLDCTLEAWPDVRNPKDVRRGLAIATRKTGQTRIMNCKVRGQLTAEELASGPIVAIESGLFEEEPPRDWIDGRSALRENDNDDTRYAYRWMVETFRGQTVFIHVDPYEVRSMGMDSLYVRFGDGPLQFVWKSGSHTFEDFFSNVPRDAEITLRANCRSGDTTFWIVEKTIPLAALPRNKDSLHLYAKPELFYDAAIGEELYTTVSDALAAADGRVVSLLHDVEGEGHRLPAGKRAVLDLNGYVLRGDGTNSVIVNEGELTLMDSSESGTGQIVRSGDRIPKSGGGVCNLGCFTLESGWIAGCRAVSQGGGIYGSDRSVTYIRGGEIFGCWAEKGSSIYSLGRVEVSGGAIRERMAFGKQPPNTDDPASAWRGASVFVTGGIFGFYPQPADLGESWIAPGAEVEPNGDEKTKDTYPYKVVDSLVCDPIYDVVRVDQTYFTTNSTVLAANRIYRFVTNVTLVGSTTDSTLASALSVTGGTTVIYIDKGVTVALTGSVARVGNVTYPGAGLRVPEHATVIVTGEGTLLAKGSDSTMGERGCDAEDFSAHAYPGDGGHGGAGASAAVGGVGGIGGNGEMSRGYYVDEAEAGRSGEGMGRVVFLGNVRVSASSCLAAAAGGEQGKSDYGYHDEAGGGGGGGSGGVTAYAIGGGAGGGGGGSRGETEEKTAGAGGFGGRLGGNNGQGEDGGGEPGVGGVLGEDGEFYVGDLVSLDCEYLDGGTNRTGRTLNRHNALRRRITVRYDNEYELGSFEAFVGEPLPELNPEIIKAWGDCSGIYCHRSESTDDELWYDAEGNAVKSCCENDSLGDVTLYFRLSTNETVAIIEDEKLGTLKFKTLAAAVAAAKYGSTITIVGDVTDENVKIPSGMTVRIGPNGQFRPPKAEDLLHDYYMVKTNFDGDVVVSYEYMLDADKVAPRVGDDVESGTPWLEFVVDEKTGLVTSAILNIVNAYEDLYYGVDSGTSPTELNSPAMWLPTFERGSLRLEVPAAESGHFYRVRATDHVGGTMPDGSGYRLMAE